MKTVVLSFRKRTSNVKLDYELDFIKFLNGYTIYADKITVLSKNDDNGLIEALSSDYDLAFVLNSEDAGFYLPSVLGRLNVAPDKDGFWGSGKVISIVPTKFNDDYPEKLERALAKKFSISFSRVTFKLYGVRETELSKVIGKITATNSDVFFNVSDCDGDVKVSLIYGDTAPKKSVDRAIREFISALKSRIYAEDDISLEKRFYDVVKLRKQTVCTAESMTGGNIAAKIVSVDGASDVFYEGLVTYDTLAKERRLDVSHATVTRKSVVSEEVAYEMAKGLLAQNNCTLAITITGYAGSNVNPSKDDGLCFIGIGTKEKVQVYSYKFKGNRKENIEKATNAALFLAIKTVENLDSL